MQLGMFRTLIHSKFSASQRASVKILCWGQRNTSIAVRVIWPFFHHNFVLRPPTDTPGRISRSLIPIPHPTWYTRTGISGISPRSGSFHHDNIAISGSPWTANRGSREATGWGLWPSVVLGATDSLGWSGCIPVSQKNLYPRTSLHLHWDVP